MWQPNWNDNQTVLVAVIHTSDRDTGPLGSAEAGNWSLGIVEQSQGEVAVDCGGTDRGDVREDIGVGNACGGKLGSHGSKEIQLSHA